MQSQRFQNLAHLEANINFFLQTASTKTHILLIAFSISFVHVLTRTRWSNPCASAMVSLMRQWSKNFYVQLHHQQTQHHQWKSSYESCSTSVVPATQEGILSPTFSRTNPQYTGVFLITFGNTGPTFRINLAAQVCLLIGAIDLE